MGLLTKTKNRILIISVMLAALLTFAAFLTFKGQNTVASEYGLATDLFDGNNIIITAASNVENYGSAMKLTGRENSTATVSRKVTGKFDISVLPFGDIDAFSLVIEGAEDSFEVNVDLANAWQASVVKEEKNYGIFYYGGAGIARGQTVAYNARNQFTLFEKGKFSLSYNPSDGTVFVNNTLVWNVSNEVNDGKDAGFSVENLTEYNVSLKFGKTKNAAGLFIFEIDGQKLGESILVDSAAPKLVVEKADNAIVGESIKLPDYHVFDVVDTDVDVAIAVRKDGADVTVTNGEFIPTVSGVYTVTYSASDDAGYTVKEIRNVEAFATSDLNSQWYINGELTENFGKQSYFKLPTAEYSDNLSDGKVKAKVEVSFGANVLYSGFGGEDFCFENDGEYILKFIPQAGNCADNVKTTNIYVDGRLTLSTPSFSDELVTGTKLSLPESYICQNGESVKAKTVVVFPDGSSYSNTSFYLSVAGVYTVEYSAEIDGKTVTLYKTFTAKCNQEDLFTGINATLEKGSFKWDCNYNGVMVSQKAGGKVQYNKVINVADYTKNDAIISILPQCEIWGTADYSKLTVRLTDIYDENNYVNVVLDGGPTTPNTLSHVRVGLPGQIEAGIADEGAATERLFKNIYGFPLVCSFACKPFVTFPLSTFDVCYDAENLEVHTTSFLGRSRVAQLTSAKYFTKAFEGFTTGEVYVSVQADGLNSAEVKYLITSVDGNSLATAVEDSIKPKISVEDYSDIYALVNKKIVLHNATAFDNMDGNLEVEANVKWKKSESDIFDINVTDGAFIPLYAGEYIIEYTATDFSGNVSRITFNLEAKVAGEEIVIELTELNGTSEVGTLFVLPSAQSSGGSGETVVSAQVKDPDGKTVEVENGNFRPQKSGEYKIIYTATDEIAESASKTYVLTVGGGNKIIFAHEETVFPEVLVNGSQVILPTISAIKYSEGEAENVPVKVKAVYGETVTELGDNLTFIPEVASDRDVIKIVYYAGENEYYAEFSQDITVLITADKENSSIAMDKYVYSADGKVSVSSSDNGLILSADEEGAHAVFANPVMSEYLVIEIDNDRKGKLDSFDVILYSAYDLSKTVRLNIVKQSDGSAKIGINGENFRTITGSFTDELITFDFILNYDSASYSFTDTIDLNLGSIKKYEDGSAFDGFDGGLVYIAVDFGAMSEESSLILKVINNQVLSKVSSDFVSPQVNIDNSIGGIYHIGDSAVIGSAVAADVFSYAEITVTVTDPDFLYVTADDGTILKESKDAFGKTFKFCKNGVYLITYSVTDMFGIRTGLDTIMQITVRSEQDPTITVNGKMPKEMRVGKTLTLPEITAADADGNSEGLTFYLTAVDPDSIMTLLQDGTFTPQKEGTYRLRFAVYDKFYNCGYVNYVITVKK